MMSFTLPVVGAGFCKTMFKDAVFSSTAVMVPDVDM
jgi:hypothetical protein